MFLSIRTSLFACLAAVTCKVRRISLAQHALISKHQHINAPRVSSDCDLVSRFSCCRDVSRHCSLRIDCRRVARSFLRSSSACQCHSITTKSPRKELPASSALSRRATTAEMTVVFCDVIDLLFTPRAAVSAVRRNSCLL